MCLLVVLHPPATAATPEAEVKAAYIFNFASFVEWPDNAANSVQFRICVAGRSDIASVLEGLIRGQRISGRAIIIQQIGARHGEQARSCNIMFLGRGSDTSSILLRATSGLPVLTISDRGNGTRGGMIEFLIRDGRVRFAVDRELARRHRLALSAKLIEVAVSEE